MYGKKSQRSWGKKSPQSAEALFDQCFLKVILTIERLIKENARQGKRSDLAEKRDQEQGTCVQSQQELNRKGRRQTTRGLMAQRLGISTATFSKYRSILKLPEELVEAIAQLLDENRINFTIVRRSMRSLNRRRCFKWPEIF